MTEQEQQQKQLDLRSASGGPQTKTSNNAQSDLAGDRVVQILHFQCRRHGFDPWLGEGSPRCHTALPENKTKSFKKTEQS